MIAGLTKNLIGKTGVNPGPEISGIGISLPEQIVTNDELIQNWLKDPLGSSDEWITQRVGVKERRFCRAGSGLKLSRSQGCSRGLEGGKAFSRKIRFNNCSDCYT